MKILIEHLDTLIASLMLWIGEEISAVGTARSSLFIERMVLSRIQTVMETTPCRRGIASEEAIKAQ